MLLFFFVKQKTAYEMRISDWSSDVCSSDLPGRHADAERGRGVILPHASHQPQQQGGTGTRAGRGQELEGRRPRRTRRGPQRSEERSVGKECVSSGSSRGSPYHYTNKNKL